MDNDGKWANYARQKAEEHQAEADEAGREYGRSYPELRQQLFDTMRQFKDQPDLVPIEQHEQYVQQLELALRLCQQAEQIGAQIPGWEREAKWRPGMDSQERAWGKQAQDAEQGTKFGLRDLVQYHLGPMIESLASKLQSPQRRLEAGDNPVFELNGRPTTEPSLAAGESRSETWRHRFSQRFQRWLRPVLKGPSPGLVAERLAVVQKQSLAESASLENSSSSEVSHRLAAEWQALALAFAEQIASGQALPDEYRFRRSLRELKGSTPELAPLRGALVAFKTGLLEGAVLAEQLPPPPTDSLLTALSEKPPLEFTPQELYVADWLAKLRYDLDGPLFEHLNLTEKTQLLEDAARLAWGFNEVFNRLVAETKLKYPAGFLVWQPNLTDLLQHALKVSFDSRDNTESLNRSVQRREQELADRQVEYALTDVMQAEAAIMGLAAQTRRQLHELLTSYQPDFPQTTAEQRIEESRGSYALPELTRRMLINDSIFLDVTQDLIKQQSALTGQPEFTLERSKPDFFKPQLALLEVTNLNSTQGRRTEASMLDDMTRYETTEWGPMMYVFQQLGLL